MRKFIFLIPFFLFACKKNEPTPKITARQQPSKITVYSIDTGTGSQSLQYEINYFYNDSTRKFDSIVIAGNIYRFDYSKLVTENKIVLNYTNASSSYDEIIFDGSFYSLKTYNEILSPPAVNAAYNFSYDGAYKLTNINYTSSVSDNNFSKSFLYKNDSIFIHTSHPSSACQTTDSVSSSYVNMGSALPFLLFVGMNNTCASIPFNILKALPVSNATNSFPAKIINGNKETDFSYTGDSNLRLSQASILTRQRNDNLLLQELKMVITY